MCTFACSWVPIWNDEFFSRLAPPTEWHETFGSNSIIDYIQMTDVNVFNWWVELQLMSLIIVTYDVIFILILLIIELQFTITYDFRIYSQVNILEMYVFPKPPLLVTSRLCMFYCCDIVIIINMLESCSHYWTCW